MNDNFKNSKQFFRGYASIFGVADRAGDIILPGSFEPDFSAEVPLLFEHKPERKLGSITRIVQNKRGLYVEGVACPPPDSSDKYALSIGFMALESGQNGLGQRVIRKFRLFEVSITRNPANKWAYVKFSALA